LAKANCNRANKKENMHLFLSSPGQERNLLPNKFALYQNYPNPFNANTNIEFRIPKNEFVTLKIFNLLGEEVATLLSASLLSGYHTVNWDGSDLASGVYFYRLKAGEFVQIRKALLLK
jgi:hypothetical protein